MRIALAAAAVSATLAGALPAASTDASKPVMVRQAKVDGHGVRWWAHRARANGAAMRWLHKRVARFKREARAEHATTAVEAITYVFGPYASQALRVFYCETGGTYSPYASNGQYKGIAQMGESERARYGHGWNVWAQAVSAYRYFAASGFTWRAWSCKP